MSFNAAMAEGGLVNSGLSRQPCCIDKIMSLT